MNALRLLFGTLTVLPVRPPTSVDRRTAGWAMTLAPLAGLVLAVVVGVPLAVLHDEREMSPLLLAALAVAALALLTRAIHLDGLADTADGLGSGRSDSEALEVMKRSDIGPFGVVTLVLVLLVQAAALATCLAEGFGVIALVLALLWSRVTVTWLCFRHPQARPDGLGSLVARSVSGTQLALTLAFAAAGTAVVLGAGVGGAGRLEPDVLAVLAGVLGVLTGPLLAEHAVRRFGGATGDVYGAGVETTFTAVLVAATLF